jgi:phenylalanyl-tRNA synthetase alpha chain
MSIDKLHTETLAAIEAAATPEALEAVRVAAMGKQGSITALLKTLGGMSPDERAANGPAFNGLRETVTAALAAKKAALDEAALNAKLAAEQQDMTLPVALPATGSIHPVSQVMDELAEIFADLGYAVADGPEIEDEWHNFSALNIPESHPARAMHDTFYIDGQDSEGKPLLLRTHTSPMQVRHARTHVPPIKVIAPGRTYRVDSDATHSPMFNQVEGLWIDEDISFAHLKGVYTNFLQTFFETDQLKVRFRPSYFPFTEPSAEVDMAFESGPLKGRWLEISGAGQVHPTVVRNFGLDPERYIGFAFGSGLERLTMLRYGIGDLRLFFENDLRFLQQFQS